MACNMTTFYPLRFYHCNNITHYKHESTLSLTSALDGSLQDCNWQQLYRYGTRPVIPAGWPCST